MKILSCNNTMNLAQQISDELGIEIINRQLDKFPDGELSIKINDDLYQKNILITHELYPNINENLLQFLFLINAAKKRGAKRIHAIIPYFAYSRMDYKKNENDFISASSIAALIESAGLDTLITIDLHSSQIEGFFRIAVKNITMLELFENDLKNYNTENGVIISPDIGGKARSMCVSKFLNIPLSVIYKQRDAHDKISMNGIMGAVKGMNCILVDDIISSGATIVGAIDILESCGAKTIELIVTHNLIDMQNIHFHKIIDKVNQFRISNTIRVDYRQMLPSPKLKITDISKSIIRTIKSYFMKN